MMKNCGATKSRTRKTQEARESMHGVVDQRSKLRFHQPGTSNETKTIMKELIHLGKLRLDMEDHLKIHSSPNSLEIVFCKNN